MTAPNVQQQKKQMFTLQFFQVGLYFNHIFCRPSALRSISFIKCDKGFRLVTFCFVSLAVFFDDKIFIVWV